MINYSILLILNGILLIEIILLYLLIPFLRYLKIGQAIRNEGPRTHFTKKGTPIIGGLIFTILSLISFVLIINYQNLNNQYELTVIITTIIGYLLIGLIDDLLKIITKKNEGIKPTLKFIMQLVIGIIIYIILLNNNHDSIINLGFTKVNLKAFYGIFIVFLFSATTNAVNISDGLDGLASGLVIIALGAFTILGYYTENYYVFYLGSSFIIMLIGFLIFNFNPALIFMGDAGSMVLGSVIVIMAVILKMEILILIIGMVFVIEILSDIIQVIYYKLTKGKRIFLMAPLHHHFEYKKYTELQIDIFFWGLGIFFAFIGIVLGVKVF